VGMSNLGERPRQDYYKDARAAAFVLKSHYSGIFSWPKISLIFSNQRNGIRCGFYEMPLGAMNACMKGNFRAYELAKVESGWSCYRRSFGRGGGGDIFFGGFEGDWAPMPCTQSQFAPETAWFSISKQMG